MIDGPISDDIFWFDESVNDSGFLDDDDDHFSSGSSDDWGWDEWGDLVVFRPIGHEPHYQYPLVLWLSVDDTIGITLRDWFPDLSERNYLGAEISISPQLTPSQNANRISLAIREIAAQYRVHRERIWIAGVGPAADCVLRLLAECPGPVTGGVAINPTVSQWGVVPGETPVMDQSKTLYLATESGAEREAVRSMLAERGLKPGQYACPEWESIDFSRLAVCRDLNVWLMQQVCTPAGLDSCG